MNAEPELQRKPVEIARIVLKRLTALNEPPTPENYVREYHCAAGLATNTVVALEPSAVGEDTLEMVRTIVAITTGSCAGLSSGVEQFDSDSTRALATMDQIRDPNELALLLRTVSASALSLKQVIDVTRQELTETRGRLDVVSNELNRSQELSRTDPLTGFGNRRAMSAVIVKEIASSCRTKAPFSVAMLDLDHFKQINDKYGHDIGDRALKHLAFVAKTSLRETDEAFRYGGEEFVVALPGATAEGARFVMDRMRGMVEKTPLVLENVKLTLRFSAGVAELAPNDNEESLLKRADRAMYEAKSTGRNRVLVAASPTVGLPLEKVA